CTRIPRISVFGVVNFAPLDCW
nr:immunoglobulin heavy chain junction region [Macaca mulatta]MOX95563.1 immunoglobulin heavy chain junction region [Macaca mulatta]MOX97127.1 immunoglobulin heavy chain junction region [Macaca mulatta]